MEKKVLEKKELKFCGIEVWRIFTYFVIYSIVGFILETIFGLLTEGVIESRSNLIFFRMCCIYGVGAVVLIISLNGIKKSRIGVFFLGVIVGSTVEYLVSFFAEKLYYMKWWDYSYLPFNLNGRICLLFSIFWGIISVVLVTFLNEKVDRIIDIVATRVKLNLLKKVLSVLFILMLLDFFISTYALNMFLVRLINNYNIELQDYNQLSSYIKISENEKVNEFTTRYFSDEKMLKIFPNTRLVTKDGKMVLVSEILDEIEPYYYRVFRPRK